MTHWYYKRRRSELCTIILNWFRCSQNITVDYFKTNGIYLSQDIGSVWWMYPLHSQHMISQCWKIWICQQWTLYLLVFVYGALLPALSKSLHYVKIWTHHAYIIVLDILTALPSYIFFLLVYQHVNSFELPSLFYNYDNTPSTTPELAHPFINVSLHKYRYPIYGKQYMVTILDTHEQLTIQQRPTAKIRYLMWNLTILNAD